MSHLLPPSSPSVRCYNPSPVSVPGSTDTALPFPSPKFDHGTAQPQWSAQSPTRLTCRFGGDYLIGFSLAFAASAGGAFRVASLRHNGGTILCQETRSTLGATQPLAITCTTLYALASGDYLEVVVRHDSMPALTIMASASFSPDLWFVRVA